MDWWASLGLVKGNWRNLSLLLRLFATLRARSMQEATLCMSWPEQRGVMLLLVLAITGVFTIGYWLVDDVGPENLAGVRLTVVALATTALVTAPYLVGYYALQRASLPFAAISLLVASLLAAVLATVPGAVAVNLQPMRSDFPKIALGLGHGTAAYDFVCGGLDRTVALTSLGRRTIEVASEDAGLQRAWARSSDAATLNAIQARRDGLSSKLTELGRDTVTLWRASERAEASFWRTYHALEVANTLVLWGLAAVGVWTVWTLARGMYLGVETNAGRLISSFALIAMLTSGGLLNHWWEAIHAESDPEAYVVYHGTPRNAAELREYEALVERWRNERPQREARLHALFLSQRTTCPDLNGHGLW